MSFPRALRGGSPRPVMAFGSREKTKPTEGPWVEFMRVAIIGVGGLGRTLASELRTDPRVSSLLLIDEFGERARVLTGIRGRVAIEATQLNVENRIALAKALAGADVVVNTTLPKYNLPIMQAALEAHSNYLDTAAAGPKEPGATPGIFEQLATSDAFEDAGATALISMGLDPGISNVMVCDAAARFDVVDAVRIRSSDMVTVPGLEVFPLYSREAFLSDVLVRPSVWLDGQLQDREPLSEPEEFPFPPPVGTKRTYLVAHEEVKTLPRYLGKPLGRVDYKYAMDPNLVRALISLDRLGLIADNATLGPGVHSSEVLDPARVFKEWAARDLPMEWSERVVET